ncbi:MAG: peptidoglycan bridge formation glycyltransferase FemA/FemB family protein [Candidatus Promineifilaceae bacterium]
MLERLLEIEMPPYNEEDEEWDAFVAGHPHGSILQTTNWARLKSSFGWRSNRVWLRKDGRLVAGAQVLVRSAAFGMMKVAYVPHGPLVDWSDDEQVNVAFNQLDFSAYELGAGMLKMEPLLWHSEMAPAAWEALCEREGSLANTDTIQPPRTILVDLRPSEDDILAAMKSKTRYNIRLAEKKGVTVRVGTAEDIRIFNQLMFVTGRRNEFGVHEPLYYKTAYDLFAPQQAALFIAEYEEKPLAAIMVFTLGDKAAYLYGASSNEERQRMPTYAVQWAAVQWAKDRGCTSYDLWGVPDEPEDTLEAQFTERDDGLWGVYRFKRGFGGQVVRTVGTADRVYNKLVYRLYQWRRGVG